jgi:hypothetical protein
VCNLFFKNNHFNCTKWQKTTQQKNNKNFNAFHSNRGLIRAKSIFNSPRRTSIFFIIYIYFFFILCASLDQCKNFKLMLKGFCSQWSFLKYVQFLFVKSISQYHKCSSIFCLINTLLVHWRDSTEFFWHYTNEHFFQVHRF